MIVNLELLRSVVRPFASHAIGLSELLEKLWPILLDADADSRELVASVEDLLAMHAARSIDDIALRQRLIEMAFSPGEIGIFVSDIRSSPQAKQDGRILKTPQTFSNPVEVELTAVASINPAHGPATS